MSMSSVLVAVRGERCDDAVVRLGCELLNSSKGKLYVLNVIEVERGFPEDAEIPPATAKAEEVLQRAEEVVKSYKCSTEAYMRQTRRAGVAVVREAVDKGVDTIVLGVPYRERYGSFTLGDTIPYVLKHAPCRVIVWREPTLEVSTNGRMTWYQPEFGIPPSPQERRVLPPVNRDDTGSRLAVIMGCGRLGVSIATALSEEGYDLRILDTDIAAFDLFPPGMIEEGHVVPFVADGTLESGLRAASTQDADIFIAVAGRDVRNALAAQIAQHIFRVPTVICRINDPARKEMYDQLGLMTISATKLATDTIVRTSVG